MIRTRLRYAGRALAVAVLAAATLTTAVSRAAANASSAANATSAHACSPTPSVGLGLVPTYDDPYPAYSWEGRWRSATFTYPSAQTGACLSGTVFAPADVRRGASEIPTRGLHPGVVIGPGSGSGVEAMYQWAARDLAGHGYIAVTIDPQGVGKSGTFGSSPCVVPPPSDPTQSCPGVPFQHASNYVDAIETALNFLVSRHDPFRSHLDPSRLGAAGHSLSARAVSYAQMIDPRIKAIVAWDNLASDLTGDAGSPSGGGVAGQLIGGEVPGSSIPVAPTVPALGEASDNRGTTEPTNSDPDQKKTAFAKWRAATVPSMEVVFKGVNHFQWAQNNTTSSDTNIKNFEYYTRGWFDRFLLGDAGATRRLLATTVNGQPVANVLSSQFRSAAFLDGIDCQNLLACPG
jgi:dienelactone hydrolase